MNKPFKFKEFTVEQDQCAMKIGTDAVLLGAWAGIEHDPDSILDIGTGTGVIALMLAQRSQAEVIDALEVEEEAYEQAVQNFENSPWGDRLFCYHGHFMEFVEEFKEDTVYDLIISNPPFYAESYPSGNNQRDRARGNQALPFPELIRGARILLSERGRFCLIVPFQTENEILGLATAHALYPLRITRVKGSPESPIKRSLLELGFIEKDPQMDEITIEITRHQYTADYLSLVRDFYLNM